MARIPNITKEQRAKYKLSKDLEKNLEFKLPGDDLPKGYWWDKRECIHDPFGHFIKGYRGGPIKIEEQDLRKLLQKFAGNGVHKAVKKLVMLALGKDKSKTTVGQQMQYCTKIIDYYHGQAAANKNIENNTTITVEHRVSELTKLINDKKKENNIIELNKKEA